MKEGDKYYNYGKLKEKAQESGTEVKKTSKLKSEGKGS